MWFWRKVTIMIILMTPSSGLRRTEENPLYRSTCREKKKEKLSVLETDVYDLFHCRKVWVLGRKKGQCNLISIVFRSELRDIRFLQHEQRFEVRKQSFKFPLPLKSGEK